MSETVLHSLDLDRSNELLFCQSVEALPRLITDDPSAAHQASIHLRANQEIFATALADEQTAPAVVSSLSRAMRGAHSEYYNRAYFMSARHAYHNLSNLITEDIAEELITCAEGNAGSDLDLDIATLLLESHVAAAGSTMSAEMSRFLIPRLPRALTAVSRVIAPSWEADWQWPAVSILPSDTRETIFRINDALQELVPTNPRGDTDALKQSLTELTELSDSDGFIKFMLQELLSRWNIPSRIGNLLGMRGADLSSALSAGFGHSPKNPIPTSEYKLQSIKRMLALEKQRPGICRILYRENRFRNFGRHSEDFFLDAYDRRDELSSYDKLVYILFNTSDHNGSVLRNSGPKLEELRKQLLAKNIGVVAAEFLDERDLKILMRQAKLAKLAKANIVISDSHGDGDTLGSTNGITKQMLEDWLGDATAELTTEDAELFLMACSTADFNDGFAAELYTRSRKRTVFAARGGAYLRRIDFILDKHNNPRLVIDSRRKGNTPGPPPLRTFKRGRSFALPIRRRLAPLERKLEAKRAQLAEKLKKTRFTNRLKSTTEDRTTSFEASDNF